jgi:hypothetical protein
MGHPALSKKSGEHMKFGNIKWILILFMAADSYAEESISNRAIKVQSKLEVLNNLGRECEVQLQVNGMKGSSSKDCDKYLKNIRGEYFKSLGQECPRCQDSCRVI